jgi:hypothetical protein
MNLHKVGGASCPPFLLTFSRRKGYSALKNDPLLQDDDIP